MNCIIFEYNNLTTFSKNISMIQSLSSMYKSILFQLLPNNVHCQKYELFNLHCVQPLFLLHISFDYW